MITVEDLKQFGKVERCEVVNDSLHVEITDGFKSNFDTFLRITDLIKLKTDNNFPLIGKSNMDDNLFKVEFKKRGSK